MPPSPQIHIIGAGLAGLVLGRALLHRGIPSLILDKAPNFSVRPRNHHGIILFLASYRPLLPILDLDDAAFRRKVAVDAGIGGVGKLGSIDGHGNEGFRANRGRLERLLAEGLEIRWEREVEGVSSGGDGGREGGGVEVRFRDGEVWRGEREVIVVGADGPHSVVRGAVAPTAELEVLPFAVYNGRRRYTADDFGRAFGSAFDGGNALETRCRGVRLGVGIDEHTNDEVHVSFTFSRPARGGEDALFKTRRSKSAAKEIPEAFFEEMQDLRESVESPAFREAFDVEKLRGDRMLNWLMRTARIESDRPKRSIADGVVLMGDAAHAEAILGGQGANEAIVDGLQLAEAIGSKGTQGLGEFYDARDDSWAKSNRKSRDQIYNMHDGGRPNL